MGNVVNLLRVYYSVVCSVVLIHLDVVLPAAAGKHNAHEAGEFEASLVLDLCSQILLDGSKQLIMVKNAVVKENTGSNTEYIGIELNGLLEGFAVQLVEFLDDFLRHVPGYLAVNATAKDNADTLEIVKAHFVLTELGSDAALLYDMLEGTVLLVDNSDQPTACEALNSRSNGSNKVSLLPAALYIDANIESNIFQIRLSKGIERVGKTAFLRNSSLEQLCFAGSRCFLKLTAHFSQNIVVLNSFCRLVFLFF